MNSLEVIFKDKIKFEPYKVFEVNNKKNIYTTNIGGIYEIDENVMHVLNEDGKTLDEIYNNLSTKLKKDDIDKILNNMIDLKILRLKNEEIIENDYKNEALHLPGITLMICQDCNMRCSYCFAGDGEYSNKGYMDIDTAKKSIDFLIENSEEETLQVCLFGGEPLLNFKLFKDIVDYCKHIEPLVNKKFLITTTINGTLLNKEIEDYLVKNNITVQLSIDGDEDTHNSNSYFANKVKSYDLIMKKTKNMREKGILSSRATVTNNNLDMISTFEHLYDLNFRAIPIVPAYNSLKQDDYDNVENAYSALIDYFENLIKVGDFEKANKMTIIKNSLKRIHTGYDRNVSCGVGNGSCAVDINGELYPCHRFVSSKEHKIGDIYNGFEGRKEFIKSVNVENDKECSECWAKNLCVGGCPNETMDYKKNKSEDKFNICEITKFIYENLINVYIRLTEEEKKQLFTI